MPELNHQSAVALFDYHDATGIIRWRVKRRPTIQVGDVAGALDSDGYIKIKTGGRSYLAHRLAWFLTHGVWPSQLIDHINGIRHDNRISNLREASHLQNQHNSKAKKRANSKSELKGVSFCAQTSRWKACIEIDGKYVWLGRFNSEQEAHAAYVAASQSHFHQFARA